MDLQNKSWIVSGEADDYNSATLEFYIDMDPIHTMFKNFGHEFLLSGPGADSPDESGQGREVVISADDLDNIQDYNEGSETEFPFLVERHFLNNLVGGGTYTLELMFKNRREIVEDVFSFTVPKPPKPYESWVWNERSLEWVAPSPPPQPVWDEDLQQWILS